MSQHAQERERERKWEAKVSWYRQKEREKGKGAVGEREGTSRKGREKVC